MLPLHRQRKMLDENYQGVWERLGRKTKKNEQNNRGLGYSTVKYFVGGFLVVKKYGGLLVVQVVTEDERF